MKRSIKKQVCKRSVQYRNLENTRLNSLILGIDIHETELEVHMGVQREGRRRRLEVPHNR
jgi:hypothetical protein